MATADLLGEFLEGPAGEKYSTPTSQCELLVSYLALRHLGMSLPFGEFLQKTAAAASGGKPPGEVVKEHRGSKDGPDGLSLREMTDALGLYIDIFDLVEPGDDVIPLELFITSLIPHYRSGEMKPAARQRRKSAGKNAVRARHIPPSTVGQRIVYTSGAGVEILGTVTQLSPEAGPAGWVSFITDTGECYSGRSRSRCRVAVADDAGDGGVLTPPDPPAAPPAEHTLALAIPRHDWSNLCALLDRTGPVDCCEIGTPVLPELRAPVGDAEFTLAIINGGAGPYVDAAIELPGGEILDLEPRRNLAGQYRFSAGNGVNYAVTVGPLREEPACQEMSHSSSGI